MTRKQKGIKQYDLWKNWSKKINARVSPNEHLSILGFSLLFSVLLYLIIIKLFPITFTIPKTTSINWLTVNNYPKQQDYYLFFSFIGFVYLFTLLICFICLSLKTK